MDDPAKARPVSGEIMTERDGIAAAGSNATRVSNQDAVDAEFETIGRVPEVSAPEPGTPAPSGMTFLRNDVTNVRQERRHAGPVFWLTGVALAVASFWTAGGHAVIHRPRFEGLLRERPVPQIISFNTRIERSGDRRILIIDGEARNDGLRSISVPPLGIDVSGTDGTVRHYFLGTSEESVLPARSFAFSSRLEVPKDWVRSVSASFDRKE